MTDSELREKALADRAKLAQVIRRRPRVGPVMALFMSALFALLAAPLLAMDLILASVGLPAFQPGEPAPMTVRVPQFSGFSDERFELRHGAVVVARGQIVDPATAEMVRAVRAKAPAPLPAMGAYFAILLSVALVFTTYLRRSHRGRLLRTQAVTLLLLLASALGLKIVLLLTSMSVLAVPVAGFALVAALVVDLSAALVTGLAASVLVGLLVPFDLSVVSVLLVQSGLASLTVGERYHKNAHILSAGLASGLCAAVAYAAFFYLSTGQSPLVELAAPLRSGMWAAAAGGLLAAILAIPGQPIYQYLLGDITKSKLVELEDLSNPMLKQIAENSPGTWQHSLAMANMAEIAGNAIGASGRLIRVGAYYHDLGKSLQPKYFIENLEPGESSPHDRLPPEVSCDAIFAHVTEGIRLARKRGLPERIIDFMHMHHGDGLLEYFWTKCRDSGNPKNLTAEDFRYPGVPPQSRETAILAIVDAVEAASRTLKRPDERAIENLVQRIVYGKLHLGQLDDSGLSMADLRKISDSLRETIKHAHHGRIEYPWQREQQAQKQAEAQQPAPAQPQAPEESGRLQPGDSMVAMRISTTQRIINEPRLDSLDVPRPYWRERPRSKSAQTIETAPTQPVAMDTGDPSRPAAPAGQAVQSAPAGQAAVAAPAGQAGHGDPSSSRSDMSTSATQPLQPPDGAVTEPTSATPGPEAVTPAPPRKKEPAEVLRELVESVRRDEAAQAVVQGGGDTSEPTPDTAAPEHAIDEDEGSKPIPVGVVMFGPPPATRPNGDRVSRPGRTTSQVPVIEHPDIADQDRPLVEPASPVTSMLPPRARSSSGKSE